MDNKEITDALTKWLDATDADDAPAFGAQYAWEHYGAGPYSDHLMLAMAFYAGYKARAAIDGKENS